MNDKDITPKNNKTKAMTGITLGVAILLVIIGVSYAMLPTDNLPVEPIDTTASTATLKLRYTDCVADDVSTCGDISANLAPGDSVTKEFKVTNIGTGEARYSIYFKELTSTFNHDELVYKLENLTTGDTIVEETPIPTGTNTGKGITGPLTIPVGSTIRYRLTIKFLNTSRDQSDNLNAEFSIKIAIKDAGAPTVAEKIANNSKGVRTSFDEAATTDEGVFEMQDDYGTSYYYRGAVENNYVRFAGYYWRIIRLNGDGSLRIIYDGTTPHANGEASDDRFTKVSQPFNALYDDAKYVGWMYGPANAVAGTTTASASKTEAQTNTANSDIKTVVDEWYKINIQDKGYGQYVSDTLFCNDRSTPGQSGTGWSNDTGLGYAKNATAYGAYARLGVSSSGPNYGNPQPQFTCPQKNDAFTVSDTSKGNESLTYPVGLITADEIVAAGSGKYGTANNQYYLYRSSSYFTWSLSPYSFSGSFAYVFGVYTTGQLNYYNVSYTSGAVAPVINLTAEYVETLKGTGTALDPYTAS